MTLEQLIEQIKNRPETVEFNDVILTINDNYVYSETRFTIGIADRLVINEAGSNAGSCRIFAFARLNGLSESETLACFGRYYRDDVLENEGGADHANIRSFMRYGWRGIHFDQQPLKKSP
jgi:hypothetical protein